MRQEARGFTLIELMVTLVVLGTTLVLAAPSLSSLYRELNATAVYHQLTVSLAVARMGAVRRGQPVSVCPSRDGQRCSDDVVWDDGWIVFSDPQRNGQPVSVAAVLHHVERVGPGLALRSTGGRTLLRFAPDGWSHGSNVSIRLCREDKALLLGKVVVNVAGRSRTERTDGPLECPFMP
ncbi:GspH/FimT family pseudopilin [Lysobacter sp. F60174L2]|uniref:GspH/FimT family pseudopilin n=1 Tax=Lysobacter sp. F60174L2 TaxID=3459295 RepID=UPI00403DAEA9